MRASAFLVLTLGAILMSAAGVAGAQTSPAATTAANAAPAATAAVAQDQFTTAINNRAPADDITTLDNSHGQVFFYSVLKDAAGQTITHRWQYDGKTVAEVKFEPKSNHWRVWSSKKLLPSQTGTYTVQVVDANGNVLDSKTLNYTSAATTAAPAAGTGG